MEHKRKGTPSKKGANRKADALDPNSTEKFAIQSYAQLIDFAGISTEEALTKKELSLSLYAFTFTNAKWSKLLTILKFNHYIIRSLVFLDLGCCNLSNLHLEQLFFNIDFPCLQVLILAGNLITTIPFQANFHESGASRSIQNTLSGKVSTHHIKFKSGEYTEYQPLGSFKPGILPPTTITETSVASQYKTKGLLSSCPRLQTLILRNNLISEIDGFTKQLCIHKCMHELDLSCNSLINVGRLSYALMLSKVVRKLNLSATGLKTENARSLVDVCLLTKLRYLNLWCNELDEAFAQLLRDAFLLYSEEHNVHERISGTIPLISAGIHLNSVPSTSLETLNLGMNRLGDNGAIYISDLLKEQRTFEPGNIAPITDNVDFGIHLRNVDLSSNGIASRGALSLASALMLNTHLQSLNLSDNYLNVQDCEVLIKSSYNHPTLQLMNLARNNYTENEVQHLKKVAHQLAPQIHFKFMSTRNDEDDINRIISTIDKHINGSSSATEHPSTHSVQLDDIQINKLVNRSLMETISSELERQSSLKQTTTIPIRQNTFDDSEEIIQEEERTHLGNENNLDSEPVYNSFVEHDTSQLSQKATSKPITSISNQNQSEALPEGNSRPNERSKTAIDDEFTESTSFLRTNPSDDNELNDFLNEIYIMKQNSDIGTSHDGEQQRLNAANSFSQKRSQFFDLESNLGKVLLDDDAPPTTQTNPSMNFLGMLKKRGILQSSNPPSTTQSQENNFHERTESIHSRYSGWEGSEFHDTDLPSLSSRNRSLSQLQDQLHTQSSGSEIFRGQETVRISQKLDDKPPDSLIDVLKRVQDKSDPYENESLGHRSPLVSYSGKRDPHKENLDNFSSHASGGQFSQGSLSESSNRESTGQNSVQHRTIDTLSEKESQRAIHHPAISGPSSSPSPDSVASKNNFPSAAKAIIVVNRFKSLHLQAKSLTSKGISTKKKVNVDLTEEGKLIVSQQSSSLFGKGKSKVMHSLSINETLHAKPLPKGKIAVQKNNIEAFVLQMSEKDATKLAKAISDAKESIEKAMATKESAKKEERGSNDEMTFQSTNEVERRLLLDPKTEYVRGIRHFKSEGDNRLDVIVDELYKIEAKVNGWLFVSLVRDPNSRGYVLPDDVRMEDTTQYQFTS